MNENSNSLNWFEIPALDLDRARKFYETIFGIQMETMEMMNMKMAMFPYGVESGKAGGALVQSDQNRPAAGGCIIYLNANPDLQEVLNRIPSAGGSILMEKTVISADIGCMAFFTDTEGNQVALHSNR